ncbi:hypothetical protein NPIL_166091, partial [Nephila pilipes]
MDGHEKKKCNPARDDSRTDKRNKK